MLIRFCSIDDDDSIHPLPGVEMIHPISIQLYLLPVDLHVSPALARV